MTTRRDFGACLRRLGVNSRACSRRLGVTCGVGPPSCRCSSLGSSCADPPHLRLAPRSLVPPRGHARAPGDLRRPPGRGDRGGAGRPRGRRRRHLRPRPAPRRRRTPGRRDVRPAGRLPRPGGADVRQPRLGPTPRVRLAADRRGRRLPPHRRLRGRYAGPAGRRPRPGRGPRPPLPRPAGAPRAVAAAGPQPRGSPGRGDAPRARRPGRAPDALGGAGPRLRGRRPAERVGA